jgi:hypothetical protein
MLKDGKKMFFWLIFGAGAVYVISRKMNEVPIIDKAPGPVKYTYTTASNIFDKLGSTTAGGINSFVNKVEYVGKNYIGVPMYDLFFKNGTKSRIYGTEKGPAVTQV